MPASSELLLLKFSGLLGTHEAWFGKSIFTPRHFLFSFFFFPIIFINMDVLTDLTIKRRNVPLLCYYISYFCFFICFIYISGNNLFRRIIMWRWMRYILVVNGIYRCVEYEKNEGRERWMIWRLSFYRFHFVSIINPIR